MSWAPQKLHNSDIAMTSENEAEATLRALKGQFKCPECKEIQNVDERSDHDGMCYDCVGNLLNKGLTTGIAYETFEKKFGPTPPRWRRLKFRRYIRDEWYFVLGFAAHYDWLEERERSRKQR